jgi:hypothetical protein
MDQFKVRMEEVVLDDDKILISHNIKMLYIIMGCLVFVCSIPKLTQIYAQYKSKKIFEQLSEKINAVEQNKNI